MKTISALDSVIKWIINHSKEQNSEEEEEEQNLSSPCTRNEDQESFHIPTKRPTFCKSTASKALTPATASTSSSMSPLSLTPTKSTASSYTNKRLHTQLFQVNLSDDKKGRNKKQRKDNSPNDGAKSNKSTATSVLWTSEEGINHVLAWLFKPEEYRSKSPEERAKLLSTTFTPSEMKVVFTSMWIQAGNKLSELNLDSLKQWKKLDEAIVAQLCVTLFEGGHTKNNSIPNDVAVVKWVHSNDVFVTALLLFKREHFSQYAITTWNKQEREEQSWWNCNTVSCVGQSS